MSDTTVVLDASGALSAALAKALAGAGYDASVVSSGDATLLTPPDAKLSSVLFDLQQSGSSFDEAQTELRAHGWRVPVIIVTRAEQDSGPDRVPPAQPSTAVPPRIELHRSLVMHGVEDHALLARYARLTSRERQVAGLVVQGLLNKQISAKLGVAERTVKIHRARAMEKLGAHCLPDLVRCIDRVSAATSPDGQPRAALQARAATAR